MESEWQTWLDRSSARTRSALHARSAPGDRLALIQTLARLAGGRIDLNAEGLHLNREEFAILPRFGLRVTRDGKAVRIEDGDLDEFSSGFAAGLSLDPKLRTVFTACPPDAPLLRFSQHK